MVQIGDVKVGDSVEVNISRNQWMKATIIVIDGVNNEITARKENGKDGVFKSNKVRKLEGEGRRTIQEWHVPILPLEPAESEMIIQGSDESDDSNPPDESFDSASSSSPDSPPIPPQRIPPPRRTSPPRRTRGRNSRNGGSTAKKAKRTRYTRKH